MTETFRTGKSVYVLSRVTEVLRGAIHWIQIHRATFCCLILITGTNFVEWLGCFSQTRALWHWISNQRYKSTDSWSSNRSLSPGCEQTFKPLQSKVSKPPSRSTEQTIHRGQRHLEVQCVNDVDWWFKEVEPPHQMENSPVCVSSTASFVKCMKTTVVHWEAWRREAEWIRAAIFNVATRWHKFTCCTFKTFTWWKLSMKPFLPNRPTLVLLLCLVFTCCVASYCYDDNNNWQPGFGHRSALIQTELCLKVWLMGLQSDFFFFIQNNFFPQSVHPVEHNVLKYIY